MSKSSETINVRIHRFSPETDEKPTQDLYVVPYKEGQTILGLLKEIYEDQDPTLAFYHSCRIGKCTGCHLKINGKVRLSCTEIVPKGDVLIEPMPGYDVVRDLVIDRTVAKLEKKKE